MTENRETANTWLLSHFPTRSHILRYLWTPWGKKYLTFRTTDNRKKNEPVPILACDVLGRYSWMSCGLIVTHLPWVAHRPAGPHCLLQSAISSGSQVWFGFWAISRTRLEGALVNPKFGGLLVASGFTEGRRAGWHGDHANTEKEHNFRIWVFYLLICFKLPWPSSHTLSSPSYHQKIEI